MKEYRFTIRMTEDDVAEMNAAMKKHKIRKRSQLVRVALRSLNKEDSRKVRSSFPSPRTCGPTCGSRRRRGTASMAALSNPWSGDTSTSTWTTSSGARSSSARTGRPWSTFQWKKKRRYWNRKESPYSILLAPKGASKRGSAIKITQPTRSRVTSLRLGQHQQT